MTADSIQEMLDQEPFEPFRVCLSSGVSYDVTNPHMVALMKSKVFIALPDSERWTFVSYLHIAALEAITNRRHPRGRRKRRR
jgi:hypothetical protein